MIEKNKVVSLNYKLTRDNNQGELIEETYGSQPLTFLYGLGQMIPKFEEELNGKKTGDKFSFGIKAAEAYGENNAQMVVDLPASIFMVDGKIDTNTVKVGAVLPMQDNEGHQMNGMVVEMNDETIKMDFNHPLAGQDLFFDGDIVEVRDATAEELEHGHVHGAGGHQH